MMMNLCRLLGITGMIARSRHLPTPNRTPKLSNRLVLVLVAFSVLASVPLSSRSANVDISAFSLQAMQRDLRACLRTSSCERELLTFDGLTRIDGYVLDPENDVVLFGVREAGRELHLSDFLVALRSAWHTFDERRGRTRIFTPPGVTIDPRPATLLELQEVMASVAGAADAATHDAAIEEWARVGRRKQDVRVLGVPFDTHFSDVMLRADYEMKRIVDGSLNLDVDGFSSMPQLMIDQAARALSRGEAPQLQIGGLTRFWFYPGRTAFSARKGIVRLEAVEVALLDEAQKVSREGQSSAAGHVDPIARQVSQTFSKRYDAFAQRHPVYEDLRNLFRFVALTKAMYANEAAIEASQADLSLLLTGLSIPQVKVEREVDGVVSVRSARFQRGRTIVAMRVPSCGGVTIDIAYGPSNVRTDQASLDGARTMILAARPQATSRTWQVPRLAFGPKPAARGEPVAMLDAAGRRGGRS